MSIVRASARFKVFNGSVLDTNTLALDIGLGGQKIRLKACKYTKSMRTFTIGRECKNIVATSKTTRINSGRFVVGIQRYYVCPLP